MITIRPMLISLGLCLLGIGCTSHSSSTYEGDLPTRLYSGGDFSIRVVRRARDPALQHFISQAERLPPRVYWVFDYRNPECVIRPGQWYFATSDGTKIPHALTDDAVRYYVARMRSLRKYEKADGQHVTMANARLDYTAKATRSEAGILVELKLVWIQYCGTLCALSFVKTRTVLFAPSGDLISLEGDGCASVSES